MGQPGQNGPRAGNALAGVRVTLLSAAPTFADTDAWLAAAWSVRKQIAPDWSADTPRSATNTSLSIPTWLYGHEPTKLFGTHIAKLFYNRLREDGLVTVASGGLLFGEGNAGTVPEIFQDVTQNYYRPAGQTPTPIVLLGTHTQ